MSPHELVYGHKLKKVREGDDFCECGEYDEETTNNILLAILRELKKGNDVITQGEPK